ncbi:MAG: serine--tRNA ligase [Patescibacteria group bacterium]|nr:serine--tRNA ligase [Patescibacteria group bacterium]
MLDIKYIRENKEAVKKGAEAKGYDVDLEKLLKVDDKRTKLIEKRDKLRSQLKFEGKPSKEQLTKAKKIKKELQAVEEEYNKIEKEWYHLMLLVPSIPSNESPVGDESKNKVIKTVGKAPEKKTVPKDHVELGDALDLLDIERGVKIGGTRSYILENQLVVLEQALLRLALDTVIKEGFRVMNVPVLVKEEALVGSGFFPFGKEDVYEVDEGLYLVGTSEASLIYLHSGEILNEFELPKLLSGISACFRREVGTYGKDNRGIIRVHQFNKVEQVVLCKESEWKKSFDFILNIAESIVRGLELPYRIVNVATRDMGAKNIYQNDIEVWFPSQNKYRETHSCSYLGDFQSRRANIKYRDDDGDKHFVHTLNNTAVATPRILAACLENWQQKDGSITIPKALQKYTHFKVIK